MLFDLQFNTVSAVEAIDRFSADSLTPDRFLEAYQRPGIPVIITGLLDEPDWNLEFLIDQLGDQTFPVRCYGRDRYRQDKRQWKDIGSGTQPRQMTFTEYAAALRSGAAAAEDLYLAKCPLRSTALGQRTSFDALRDRLGLRFAATDRNLWVGPSGHRESLHYDPSDGTLMQLHGEKQLLLFPPTQTPNLYPFPVTVHLRHGMKLRSWFSQTYPEQPDFTAFPKLKSALPHRREVILKAGEVIFLPAGWWHEVTSLGEGMTCSVNQFWHVHPWRAVRSLSIWRAHLGGLLAVPHSIATWLRR